MPRSNAISTERQPTLGTITINTGISESLVECHHTLNYTSVQIHNVQQHHCLQHKNRPQSPLPKSVKVKISFSKVHYTSLSEIVGGLLYGCAIYYNVKNDTIFAFPETIQFDTVITVLSALIFRLTHLCQKITYSY